ncbi:hypothetical protein V5799_014455 [Amblyomma americanum]|uniref:Uncharacterized protein n=1 Tax=Amblyomma americanum TaxID=6943 RepID=A0AAQ4E2Z4_AMBAM
MISASHLNNKDAETHIKMWWLSDCGPEVCKNMREAERQWTFRARSPQLSYRRSLVSFTIDVCKHMNFSVLTQHLAGHLVDRLMDDYDISVDQLERVALGCILIAGKAEESRPSIPFLYQILQLVKNNYTDQDMVKAEQKLLISFDWDIYYPTAAHFLDYFGIFSVFPNDLHPALGGPKRDHLYKQMQQYLNYFLEATLKDYTFKYFPPSMVAAACIVTSRACLNLAPLWSPTMHMISTYTLQQLRNCANHLLTAKDREEAETGVSSTPDETVKDLEAIGFQNHQAIMATDDEALRNEACKKRCSHTHSAELNWAVQPDICQHAILCSAHVQRYSTPVMDPSSRTDFSITRDNLRSSKKNTGSYGSIKKPKDCDCVCLVASHQQL